VRTQRLALFLPFLLTLVMLAACSAPATPPQASAPTLAPPTAPPVATEAPRPLLIVDADMGAADVLALLYLLQHPELDVAAITVTGTGEAHCEPGVRHALGLIALADAGAIPVACGREQPLAGDNKFPTLLRQKADSDMGIAWPEVTLSAAQPAADLLIATINAAPQKVVLVTLGPLTNIAEALQAEPALVERLEMVYIMGGAFDVPGNVAGLIPISDNRTAEFNLYVDPHAARVVLESGAPITFVPLDGTNTVPISWGFYKTLEANQHTPAAAALLGLFQADPSLYQGGQYFWDALAAVVATDEQVATFEEKTVAVTDTEGDEEGRTQEDPSGRPVRVVTAADAAQFEQRFLSVVNGSRAITIPDIAPDIVVTFTDEGCASDSPPSVQAGEVAIELITEGTRFETYALVVGTLDEGMTTADLEAWPSMDEPPWFNYITHGEATQNSRTLFVAEVQEGPLRMACLAAQPETKTGALGPIEVTP
jgi:inosine-uridine nucleoside N-ribohydrolase